MDRFWRRVMKGESDECWLWNGTHDPRGYGQFRLDGHGPVIRTHRLSWMLANGDIPEGMVVRHMCDNPGCVNPSHLLLGTQGDNVQDCHDRNRRPRREYCPRGHLYTGVNSNGRQFCKECRALQRQRRKEAHL